MHRTDPPTGCLVVLITAALVGGVGVAIGWLVGEVLLAFGDLL